MSDGIVLRSGTISVFGVVVMSAAAAISIPASAETSDDAFTRLRSMIGLDRCGAQAADEIIVCAPDRSIEAERFRLPLPSGGDPGARGAIAGEIGQVRIDADLPPSCGIFVGQRRCDKREALHHGYGGGLDPLSAAIKVGALLLDPDADIGPPPDVPGPR